MSMMNAEPKRCSCGRPMTPRPNDMGERLWCLPCAMLYAPSYEASPGGMSLARRR